MSDESAAILEILRSIGVYDWAVSKVKGEAELISLFKQDFSTLMRICAEGV